MPNTRQTTAASTVQIGIIHFWKDSVTCGHKQTIMMEETPTPTVPRAPSRSAQQTPVHTSWSTVLSFSRTGDWLMLVCCWSALYAGACPFPFSWDSWTFHSREYGNGKRPGIPGIGSPGMDSLHSTTPCILLILQSSKYRLGQTAGNISPQPANVLINMLLLQFSPISN